MKRISALVFCFLVFAPAFTVAQTPKPVPQLTEVEKLKVENIQLKYSQAVQTANAAAAQEKDLLDQYKVLTADIEKGHPGFTLDPKGTATLVEKPAPAKEEKPAEPKAEKK